MRPIAFGASILIGVGFATLVAASAVAQSAPRVAQANQQRLMACTQEAQVKVVGNRPTLMQERDVYVRRCMGVR